MADKPFNKAPLPTTKLDATKTPVAKAPFAAPPIAAKPAAPVAVAPKPAPVAAPLKPVADKLPEPIKSAPPVSFKAETPKPAAAIPAPAPTPQGTKTMDTTTMNNVNDTMKNNMNDTMNKAGETAKKFTDQAGETAKNFANQASERANTAMTEMGDRAKTTMEKNAKSLETLADLTRGNIEALVASGRVAAKGAEDMAKNSAEYGRSSIEKANTDVKRMTEAKSPTEFFQLQSEIAKTSLDALVSEASKFTESYLKLLGEMTQPLSNRAAEATDKIKSVMSN